MCMMCLKYRIILLLVIKTPWVILLTSGQLFDIATCLHLVSYRHLAVTVATAKFVLIFFCKKKQRTNAKSERSKGSGLARCRRRQIYAMIGEELRPYG